ncbi:MAG: hypothetical protein AB1758_19395 [Candidatus Eremiobacterota bacterium]
MLSNLGHDVLTVYEDGRAGTGAPDSAVWRRAINLCGW